jgi:polar amino acid transport system substrate-binding protein
VFERVLRIGFPAVVLIVLYGCGANSSKAPATAPTTPAAAVDLLSEVRQRGTLIIASDANYSPQSAEAADGTWSGFDVDVARQIALRLGVKPVFEAANFNLIVRGHWLGRWDIDVGSMSVTDERSKALWFSKSYYWVPGAIAARNGSNVTRLSDLSGKSVGVTAATTFQSFIEGKLTGKVRLSDFNLRVVPYDTDSHALHDLAAGDGRRVDAVLTSLPTINAAIKAGMPIHTVGSTVFEDRAAIALDRSSDRESLSLLLAVDGIIDAMHRDGTLRRLSLKYYGSDLSRG